MTLILCFGNPLCGDDAVGWQVAAYSITIAARQFEMGAPLSPMVAARCLTSSRSSKRSRRKPQVRARRKLLTNARGPCAHARSLRNSTQHRPARTCVLWSATGQNRAYCLP
jgi:hypothetical protein